MQGKSTSPRTFHTDDLQVVNHSAVTILRDMHNPLEAVANLAYLVHEEADQPDDVRHHIKLLEEQLAQITRLARRGLSLYEHTKSEIDLVTVARAALRVHDARIKSKDLRLISVLPKEALVEAHAGEMLQVISYLLENAIDALSHEAMISLRIRKCSSEIHVTILDNGQGIPDAALDCIFDPSFTTKAEHGTGLGLAICKTIVERHSGKIRTRSSNRPGRSGTAFRLTMPCASAAQK